MHGLMMNVPLMISSLIRHADTYHGDAEIVSRTTEGAIHRYTYRDAHVRAIIHEPYEPQDVRGGLGIDQQEVGPEMAIPKARPIARQGMIAVPSWERALIDQKLQHGDQPLVEIPVAGYRLDPPIVAFECSGALNPPHSDRP